MSLLSVVAVAGNCTAKNTLDTSQRVESVSLNFRRYAPFDKKNQALESAESVDQISCAQPATRVLVNQTNEAFCETEENASAPAFFESVAQDKDDDYTVISMLFPPENSPNIKAPLSSSTSLEEGASESPEPLDGKNISQGDYQVADSQDSQEMPMQIISSETIEQYSGPSLAPRESAAQEGEGGYTVTPTFLSSTPEEEDVILPPTYHSPFESEPRKQAPLIVQQKPVVSVVRVAPKPRAHTSYFSPNYPWSFSAELLGWTSGTNQHMGRYGNEANSLIYRNLITFNDQYDVGFRLGIDYELWQGGFDIALGYTYFHNSKHRSFIGDVSQSATLNEPMLDWGSIYMAANGTVFSSSWAFNLNQADLNIGNKLPLTPYYVLRPNAGLRAAYIHDAFKLNYSFYSGSATTDYVSMSNTMQTFGFIFGFDNQFKLGSGFSLNGNFDAGLLFGSTKVSYIGVSNGLTNSFFGINAVEDALGVIPVIDTHIDFSWRSDDDRIPVTVSIGYEYHAWIGAFTAISVSTSGTENLGTYDAIMSNLYAHGVTIGLKAEF